MENKKKKITIVLILLVTCIALIIAFTLTNPIEKKQSQENTDKVETIKVQTESEVLSKTEKKSGNTEKIIIPPPVI